MFVEPNAWAVPKALLGKKGEERRPGERLFGEFSSMLLVPDRIWVDTAHVIAMYSSEPVLSNIFYAVRLKNDWNTDDRLKALCLWLNTTWGILSVLANRSETRGPWIRLKMTHWRLQPVLDVTELSEESITKLARVFDKYCRDKPRRLPDQFKPGNVDPVRKGIDHGFLDALGIKIDETELINLYRMVHESLGAWSGKEEQ